MDISMCNKNRHSLVTIYTQVYNTSPFLVKCIESVLSQTFTDFHYILVDNGCTDGSSEILDRYAKTDKRIKLVRNEKNQLGIMMRLISEHAKGQYLAILDSDDWWEPDYLERLVGFLEKNNLDLAVTGTVQYFQEYRTDQLMRKLAEPLALTQGQFAQIYPSVWTFPSTTWGSVMKMDLLRQTDADNIIAKKYPYGVDTMLMLQYIKQCSRIGIDNSALYHYRIHPKSVSYQYNPRRFDANVAVYEQMKDFLEGHHTFDAEKQEWLKLVHLSSMIETLRLLRDAHIPTEQKLAECLRILKHPLTSFVWTSESEEQKRWYAMMWAILSLALADMDAHPSIRGSLAQALSILSSNCGAAFGPEELGLLAREPALWDAVKADDPDLLAALLLGLIAEKRFSKQYDLGAILHRVIPENSPLQKIEDTRFFRTYAQDCAGILKGDHIAALDHMTEFLLKNKKLYAPEQFFDLYLSLAALENQVPAFLFGKLQLAEWYLSQNRKDDCRAVVSELAEMGLENEDFSALCQKLQKLEEQP